VVETPKVAPAPKFGEGFGSKTFVFGPGLAFWLWSAYQVYLFGWQVGVHNVTETLNQFMRWPYTGGHGFIATILLALLHLVFSIYLWLSALVSAPIAAVIVGWIYALRKGGTLLIAWAKTSVVGAVVTSLLALSAAYLVFLKSGAAGALWRGFERVVGSAAIEFGLGRRKSAMSTEREQKMEATLRTSMEVLHGEIQRIGVEVPAVPAVSTLWNDWIGTVTKTVQLERQTKVATRALEHLKVVNECYRQWKDYHLLRQDIDDIEETKKINKKKREIELQELELKATLQHEVNKGELENKRKEQQLRNETLAAQGRAAKAQRTTQPESQTDRVLRLASEPIATLEALSLWETETIKKHPTLEDDIKAVADRRRREILEPR